MSLRGVMTPWACYLAAVTSRWPRLMIWTFVRWLYSTWIHFTSMRRSRQWNTFSSRPLLRSGGEVKRYLSTIWWRCGMLQGVLRTSHFSTTRSCGEIGFEPYTMSYRTGTALMTGIGVGSWMWRLWASTRYHSRTFTGWVFIFLHFTYILLSPA